MVAIDGSGPGLPDDLDSESLSQPYWPRVNDTVLLYRDNLFLSQMAAVLDTRLEQHPLKREPTSLRRYVVPQEEADIEKHKAAIKDFLSTARGTVVCDATLQPLCEQFTEQPVRVLDDFREMAFSQPPAFGRPVVNGDQLIELCRLSSEMVRAKRRTPIIDLTRITDYITVEELIARVRRDIQKLGVPYIEFSKAMFGENATESMKDHLMTFCEDRDIPINAVTVVGHHHMLNMGSKEFPHFNQLLQELDAEFEFTCMCCSQHDARKAQFAADKLWDEIRKLNPM